MLTTGSTRREKVIAQGQFFCPQCHAFRLYKHKRISEYFVLYLFPLFETQKLGEVAECQVCRTRFDMTILEPKHQVMFKVIASARYDLSHGISPEETKSRLVAMGLGDDVADMVIQMVQQFLVVVAFFSVYPLFQLLASFIFGRKTF
jgi:hypothetical protein